MMSDLFRLVELCAADENDATGEALRDITEDVSVLLHSVFSCTIGMGGTEVTFVLEVGSIQSNVRCVQPALPTSARPLLRFSPGFARVQRRLCRVAKGLWIVNDVSGQPSPIVPWADKSEFVRPKRAGNLSRDFAPRICGYQN